MSVVLAPVTYGGSLIITAFGTCKEWDNNVLRVQAVGEALLKYIRDNFAPIENIKDFLEQMKREIRERGLYSDAKMRK